MLMRVVCGSVLMYLNNQLQIMLDGASGGLEGGGGLHSGRFVWTCEINLRLH